jgi:hypothetical protein
MDGVLPLRREAVREVREHLCPVGGHEQQALDARRHAVRRRRAGLRGDDVAGDELRRAGPPERRLLVDLEPEAVAEAEEEPVVQRISRRRA